MSPKKKVKKKAVATEPTAEELALFERVVPLEIPPQTINFITLDMRLLNWNYLSFKIRTKTTTRLFTIKQQIRDRHGPVSNLRICKGHFAEANELNNDMETLQDCGIYGAPENSPEEICLIYYDFTPEQHSNPLLLASELPEK